MLASGVLLDQTLVKKSITVLSANGDFFFFTPLCCPYRKQEKALSLRISRVGSYFRLTVDLTYESMYRCFGRRKRNPILSGRPAAWASVLFLGFMKGIIPVDLFLGCSQKLRRACSEIFIGGLKVL